MTEPLFSLSDHQILMLALTAFCGALGGLGGTLAGLRKRPQVAERRRRLTQGLFSGVFFGALVFAFFGPSAVPNTPEMLMVAALFALVMGAFQGHMVNGYIDRDLEDQALLRKINECQAQNIRIRDRIATYKS
jgi:CDP-diglyceride synthetase